MKIVFIAGSLGKGGAERQLFYLCQLLKSNSFEIIVLSLTSGEYYEKELKKLNIQTKYVGQNKNKFRRLLEIYKEAKRFNPNIIYGFHFYTGFYAGIVGCLLGIQSIGSIRSNGISEKKLNGVFSWLHYALPSKIVANSIHGLQNAERIFYKKNTHFLPNIVDLKGFEFKPKNKKSDKKIIFIGSLLALKRPELFVKLIQNLRNKEVQVIGQIIGAGVLKEKLKEESKFLPIEFYNTIDDVRPLLYNADYLISTSLYEGTPNVLLEAMSVGTSVLALYQDSLETFVNEGCLLKTDNLEDIEEIILNNQSNDTLKARKFLEINHSDVTVFEKFIAIITAHK